jgi:hypothetical protein
MCDWSLQLRENAYFMEVVHDICENGPDDEQIMEVVKAAKSIVQRK